MDFINNLQHWADEGRIALIDDTGEFTFAALESRSNAVARWLIENMRDHSPVALRGDKEHDMISCLFGALKSGRPYVIIPSSYPLSRAETILKDCRAAVVFDLQAAPMAVDPAICKSVRDIDSWEKQYAAQPPPVEYWVKPGDICCIFYTSGSTGTPKGVQISGANIETFLAWWGSFAVQHLPHDGGRAMNITSYAFSASMDNLFFILATMGITLYAVDGNLAHDYSQLFHRILQIDPHFITFTPSFAAICLKDPRFGSDCLPGLQFLVVGGEPLSHTIGRQLLQRFPGVYICNAYGTTETSIGTIACQVTPDRLDDRWPVPIGFTSAESVIRIVDNNHNELPDGTNGELVIISGMVSQGYLNAPESAQKSFFTTEDGRRGYYTRDIARRENNLIYYAGRKDNLVKVGGYRVEIEDVEYHLRLTGLVRDCVVVPVMQEEQVIMLAAFVVLDEPAASSDKLRRIIAIKKALGERVQSYMIPQKIIILDEIPKNHNGKADRAGLKEISRLPS